jgi:ribosomal protein S18 acetylase RimI-like enzyme
MTEGTGEHIIVYLPADSADWGPLLAQFTLLLAGREGPSFAAWMHERLRHAVQREAGVAAVAADGTLLGLLLFAFVDDSAELTLPWTRHADADLARELAEAAVQTVCDEQSRLRHIRAERQIIPDTFELPGVIAAGFVCHWRRRMTLELVGWQHAAPVPAGYTLRPWHIRHLDAAAEVVYRANEGSTDALLYAPFFGDSAKACRRGLLAILAGRYGEPYPGATLCVFHRDTLVGVSLLIHSGDHLASIMEISVDPAHQGRGVGRALLAGCLALLRRDRQERAELAVTCDNAPALHLYETLGFTAVGDFPVCVYPLGR